MKRISAVAVVVASLMVAGTSAAASVPARHAQAPNVKLMLTASAKPGLPRVIDCADYGDRATPTIKPRAFELDCASGDAGISDISWTAWTHVAAHGHGTLYINTCEPDCARGKTVQGPTTIVLSDPVPTRFGPLFLVADVSAMLSKWWRGAYYYVLGTGGGVGEPTPISL